MTKRPPLSPADAEWDAYIKAVQPIKKIRKKVVAEAKPLRDHRNKPGTPSRTAKLPRPLSAAAPQATLINWQAPLDKKLERALRSGDIAIDATLDLHGMTQTEAHEKLAHFIAQQIKRQQRILLIITGKGAIKKSVPGDTRSDTDGDRGILRAKLRLWLEHLPQASRILRLLAAAPRHGGQGAFYVILRR